MKPKLEEYALLSQIISAVAIVLSLLFVGVQIQQSSETTQAQIRQAMLQAELDIVFYAGNNQLMTTDEPSVELGNAEQAQSYMVAMFRTRELYWWQHEQGQIDDTTYQGYLKPFMNNLVKSQVWRDSWDFNSRLHDPGFVAAINAALAEQGR
jgi:hypothetical protein